MATQPGRTSNDATRVYLTNFPDGFEELHTYVRHDQGFIPNYGERYRSGERIASGSVESAVNQ